MDEKNKLEWLEQLADLSTGQTKKGYLSRQPQCPEELQDHEKLLALWPDTRDLEPDFHHMDKLKTLCSRELRKRLRVRLPLQILIIAVSASLIIILNLPKDLIGTSSCGMFQRIRRSPRRRIGLFIFPRKDLSETSGLFRGL